MEPLIFQNIEKLPFGFLPNRSVHVLIKRRAAGGKLAQIVVLGPHEGGAVTKSSADTFAVQSAMLH